MGGDVWIGSVLADPERTNVDTARLIQNEKKNRANNSEAKSAFAGGGKKNGIAFCKVNKYLNVLLCETPSFRCLISLRKSTTAIFTDLPRVCKRSASGPGKTFANSI